MQTSLISKELCFIGAPLIFENMFLIKPLTVFDRINLGDKYMEYLNLLCLSETDLEEILTEKIGDEKDKLTKITPFDYLMLSADYNESFLLKLKEAFFTFIQQDIFIIPKARQVFVGKMEENNIIDNSNFSKFQHFLRLQNCLEEEEEIPENENYMQKKFRLRRQELKKAKQKQAEKSGNKIDFLDLMESLCLMNIGITWENIKDLPIFTFYSLLSRYQVKEKYSIDIDSLLAGADSKKIKLKYWMSHKEEE